MSIRVRFYRQRRIIIGGLIFIAILIPIIIAMQYNIADNSSPIITAFYISWTQDLLFFLLLGLSLLLLVKPFVPNEANFEERVDAFLGTSGKAKFRTTTKNILMEVGAYIERIDIEITFSTICKDMVKYDVACTQIVRNIFSDVRYTHNLEIAIDLDKVDNPPEPFGQITEVKISGNDVIRDLPQTLSNGTPFKVNDLELSIGGGKSASYFYKYWSYFKFDEIYTLKMRRFGEIVKLTIRNRNETITLKILEIQGSGKQKTVEIQPKGGSHTIIRKNKNPRATVPLFKLLKLSSDSAK